jgi:hypothetical protein
MLVVVSNLLPSRKLLGASLLALVLFATMYLLFSRARRFLGSVGRIDIGQHHQSTSIAFDLIPAEIWFAAAKWAKANQALTGWQRSLAFSLGKLTTRGVQPSEKQATHGRKRLLEC